MDETRQNDFLNEIQNINILINGLEKSISKSKKYENRLLQCKANHTHSHDISEWWETDFTEENHKCLKGSEKHVNKSTELAESWSTVSIVCLQYQYEELSKRYDALLHEYNERCNAVDTCNVSILNLRRRLKYTHEQLLQAHRAMLTVGDKYLTLRRKRNNQKVEYENKILKLKKILESVLKTAEKPGLILIPNLICLAEERSSYAAMLLAEIRKCNQLFLENLQLKTQIEECPAKNVN